MHNHPLRLSPTVETQIPDPFAGLGREQQKGQAPKTALLQQRMQTRPLLATAAHRRLLPPPLLTAGSSSPRPAPQHFRQDAARRAPLTTADPPRLAPCRAGGSPQAPHLGVGGRGCFPPRRRRPSPASPLLPASASSATPASLPFPTSALSFAPRLGVIG